MFGLSDFNVQSPTYYQGSLFFPYMPLAVVHLSGRYDFGAGGEEYRERRMFSSVPKACAGATSKTAHHNSELDLILHNPHKVVFRKILRLTVINDKFSFVPSVVVILKGYFSYSFIWQSVSCRPHQIQNEIQGLILSSNDHIFRLLV